MKRLLSVILLLGVVMQIFSKPLVWAEYNLNKEFISRVLCENKDNISLHCQGKCHLKKELAKDSENQPTRESKAKNVLEAFWITGSVFDFELMPSNGFLLLPGFICQEVIAMASEIFHPPGC